MRFMMYVLGSVFGYCLLGTITLGVMKAWKMFDGEGKGGEIPAFVFWPLVWIVLVFGSIFEKVHAFAVWIASPKAKPSASPLPPPVIDLTSVPPLPDPDTMPEEFKGKRRRK